MTPSQLTVIVEFVNSLGHTLDGLARHGIHLSAHPDLIQQIREFDHPDAEHVADRMLPVLPELDEASHPDQD